MVVQTNHLAKDLVTKGILDISILTKGMLLPFTYIIVTPTRRRHGGGLATGMPYKGLREDVEEIIKEEDIDYIKVFVKWDKKVNRDKKIYVSLLKKDIKAELSKVTNKNIDIQVELQEEQDITISAKLEK